MADHSTLSGGSLHEPKGAASATVGQVYTADGLGSGVWRPPTTDTYGEMIVSAYNTGLVVPIATVDPTLLSADADYIQLDAASMWQTGIVRGISFVTNRLLVPVAGDYSIDFWASLESNIATTLVGLKFAINQTTPYSTRTFLKTIKNINEPYQMSGKGLVALAANDTISLFIAANKANTMKIREAGVTVSLIHRT